MKPSILTFLASIGLAIVSTSSFAESQVSLADRLKQQWAVEAVIWGMPAVNYDLMRQEMLRVGGKENQIVYWSRPLDWHNQTLTPNPDAIYLMAFTNTKDSGPVVIEVPPAGDDGSINSNIVNVWQMPLEDAGPAGADKGKGGKYLILPPGYAEKFPTATSRSNPTRSAATLCCARTSRVMRNADVTKSVAYGKRIKVYPLSQAVNPPETAFTDAADAAFDSTIQYDHRFFQNLDRIVQTEPWLSRDRAMIDLLRSIGIEKGKTFNPDTGTKALLDAAAKESGAWLEERYDAGFPPFWEGSHWMFPAPPELIEPMQNGFSDPDIYPVDARGLTYSYAYIGFKKLGAGQFYLISIKDKDGNALDGGETYKLTVPPDVPVEQYWSVTTYDRETHALIKNMERASRASNATDVQKNADGSVDIYFGPTAPEGKETNWVPTDPKRQFEAMFRLYAPTKALFEKKWVLPDIEKVN